MTTEIDYSQLDYSQLDHSKLDYSKLDHTKLDFTKMVPQEFQNREYLKNIKDTSSFFKAFDGAQELLGKRPAGIPHDNASDDEWKNFNKSFGVPEKLEDYDLGKIPKGAKVDPKIDKGVREVFQKAGLNKRQAKIVSEGYRSLLEGVLKENSDNVKNQNEDFDKLDFVNRVRKIHVYCDDYIVFNTDNIFICDTVKTDKMPDVPDVLIHGTELKRLNHDTIEEIIKLADHPSKVKEFLAKNIGKEYFVTAW